MAEQPIIPYLTVKDASGAIAFYQKAFGATENMRMPAEDGKRLMHASLTINGGTLFLSDEFPEYGNAAAPKAGDKPSVAVALAMPAPANVDHLQAGGRRRGDRHDGAGGRVLGRPVRDAAGSIRAPLDAERAAGAIGRTRTRYSKVRNSHSSGKNGRSSAVLR